MARRKRHLSFEEKLSSADESNLLEEGLAALFLCEAISFIVGMLKGTL